LEENKNLINNLFEHTQFLLHLAHSTIGIIYPYNSPFMNDDLIISGIRNGGTQGQLCENELFENCSFLVNMHYKSYGLKHDDCLIAYADTIITVIGHIKKNIFEEKSSLKTYITRIFMNKCVDQKRKETTIKNSPNNDSLDVSSYLNRFTDTARGVIEKFIQGENRQILRSRINGLGGSCRQLLFLYIEEKTDQEIADAMSFKSSDVVKTTRLRCIEKLKQKK
jgi:RNA polymerase sigma factor (sigma-70 family)